MKSFTLLASLCAIFAVGYGQYMDNFMGRPFYNYQVASMAQQFVSQYGMYSYQNWEYIFPQYDQYFSQWQQIGMYVTQNSGIDPVMQTALIRHVVEYRENYTQFPIYCMRSVQQHKDWLHGNWTFVNADTAVLMVEIDNALRLGDIMLQANPMCGSPDRQMFESQLVQNITQALQNQIQYMQSSNSYLYNIVSQATMTSNFQSMFSMAIMDMYNPLAAVQQLELNFFETNESLLRKQLDNLSRALMWYINSGLMVSFTTQRDALLSTIQGLDSWPCQYAGQ